MPNSSHLMIDDKVFSEAREMMQDKFNRIIGYYLEDAQLYVSTILDGIAKKDPAIIVPAAHTIKSSSRQIGAFAIANYAATIEETARDCVQNKFDFTRVVEKCENLELLYQATEKAIQEKL